MTAATHFAAIQECSDGNDSVGNMWLEVAHFPGDTPLWKIWQWGRQQRGAHGRLLIRPLQDPTGRGYKSDGMS